MRQPNLSFLLAHPAHFVALGFGSGLSPRGPGTAGTLAAWLLFPLLTALLPGWTLFAFLLAGFIVGVIAADRTGKALGVSDHGAIVWDEMVPFWAVLALTPTTLGWQAAAFVLFRFFDIVKPQPVGWADSKVKGGFGVMLDDVIAAAYTLLLLALAKAWLGA